MVSSRKKIYVPCEKYGPNVHAVKGLLYFDYIHSSVSAVYHHLSHSFLNSLISLLSLLSQNSLSNVSPWWKNPRNVLCREGSTLLWRHLLQCLSCLPSFFSLLSQLSHLSTVSPFSNFTLSCLTMMGEPKCSHFVQSGHPAEMILFVSRHRWYPRQVPVLKIVNQYLTKKLGQCTTFDILGLPP